MFLFLRCTSNEAPLGERPRLNNLQKQNPLKKIASLQWTLLLQNTVLTNICMF